MRKSEDKLLGFCKATESRETPQSKQARFAEAVGISLNRSRSYLLDCGGKSGKEKIAVNKITRAQARFHSIQTSTATCMSMRPRRTQEAYAA